MRRVPSSTARERPREALSSRTPGSEVGPVRSPAVHPIPREAMPPVFARHRVLPPHLEGRHPEHFAGRPVRVHLLVLGGAAAAFGKRSGSGTLESSSRFMYFRPFLYRKGGVGHGRMSRPPSFLTYLWMASTRRLAVSSWCSVA